MARKFRLISTAIAIVLGVSFITGTFVLSDTLHSTFYSLISNVYKNLDFQVRGVPQFPTNDAANAVRNPIPESLVSTIDAVPGVAMAAGNVSGYAQLIAPDGSPIANNGEPTLGINFDPNSTLSSLRIVRGSRPTMPDQVVIDAATATKYKFHIGSRIRIVTQRSTGTYIVSGIAQYGSADALAGLTLAAFTLPKAQQLMGEAGEFDTINILTTPGANQDTVHKAIKHILPPGLEVVSGQTVRSEQTSSVNNSLSFFSTALGIFAVIALFVGAFTIFNTFSILVEQRIRELALLRVVGAKRRQLFGSVLGEATIIGVGSSLVGIGLGVLNAMGIEILLRRFGIALPSGPLVFETRTVVIALLAGVGVTTVAAIIPARRAVRIPPTAALRGGSSVETERVGLRLALGTALGGLGILAVALGLAESNAGLVATGAAFFFVGVAMVAPAFCGPVASAIGRPMVGLFGVTAKLGRKNSIRNPRRTAQTASALMVGLALVSAMAVFGASAKESATNSVDTALRANLIITNAGGAGLGSINPEIPSAVASLRGVTSTSTVYGGQFEVRHSVETLRAVSTQQLADTISLHVTAGSAASLSAGDLLVDADTARSEGLSIGSTVPVRFALTGPQMMRIGAIYSPNVLIGRYLVGQSFYLAHYSNPVPGAVLLDTADQGFVLSEVQRIIANYPNTQVRTRVQFQNDAIAQVNKLLGLVYALLGLAVIIALIGIANTLMLSVLERTREFGLLRVVGMKRRQIRHMIRYEALILAVFGGITGILIGTTFGAALVRSLNTQGITVTAVPIPNLIVVLMVAALLGLVAATFPARRAARLDPLIAISTE